MPPLKQLSPTEPLGMHMLMHDLPCQARVMHIYMNVYGKNNRGVKRPRCRSTHATLSLAATSGMSIT